MRELIEARIAEIEKKVAARTDRAGKAIPGYEENVATCRTMITEYRQLLNQEEQNNV